MHPDAVIAALAGRQHGCVAFGQLVGAGVGRRAVQRRVESGHLIRLHRGVYAVGHVALPPLARYAAALLAVGANAVLSHRSAAVIWRILPEEEEEEEGAPVDVSVVDGQPRQRRGIRIHRPHVERGAITTRDGLSLTDPARTVDDCARVLRPAAAERMVYEALARRLIAGPPAGMREPKLTRSELERRFLAIVRRAGFPEPETNVRVGGWEVDVLWREQRLAVELDSWRFHGHRLAFERDREKQQALAAAGLRVSRVTARQLDRPTRVVAGLAQALVRTAG